MNSGIKQPIIFFGTEDFSLYSLTALVEAGYKITAVVTKSDTRRGRGQKIQSPAVKIFAENHNIPVWQPKSTDELASKIKQLQQPIGVLVSYGKIIPQSILELFSPGIINLHPSLLPKYRGPSPIESAIANRDNKTGITIMKLVSAMDAGPIYYQTPYALDFTETRPELYKTLAILGANLLVQKLPAIANQTLKAEPQDEQLATYSKILSKQDSYLDLATTTPGDAEARIRAHLDFPRTRLKIQQHDVIVTKAHGVMDKKTPLDLICANGAYLSIDELIAPSGKLMLAADFLRGYQLD